MVTPEDVIAVPQTISDVFLAQGIVGAVALLAILIAGYLYRGRERDRAKYETQIRADREKHEAVVQKLNEDRIAEMKTGMAQLTDAIQTLEKVELAKGRAA